MWEQRIALTHGAFVAIIVAVFLSIGIAMGAGVLAIRLTFEMSHSRQVALEDTCERINELARGKLEFVGEVAPQLLPKARERFVIVKDCHAYAQRAAKARP